MAKRSAFRDTWKDYLSFSRRERRGIFAISILILSQLAVLYYLKYYPQSNLQDFSQFEKEVEAFYASASVIVDSSDGFSGNPETNSAKNYFKNKAQKEPELFAFNPNNLSTEEWQRLGFSDKQINVIKNYESKGGKYSSKEDLKKMYCISEKQYNRIEPYISIPVIQNQYKEKQSKKFERTVAMIDIGTADSTELTLLKGIGPSFARRISIYRNKLGGFSNKEQLKEVWGFTDSLYQSLLPAILLNDTLNIKKINLNSADFNELRSHPYIGYQLANLISNYRKQHQRFKTTDEIKKLPLVNDQLYSKLAPYLKVE